MSLAEEFGALLRAQRGNNSRRALARDLGISDTTLHELEAGTQNPTLARIEKVANDYGMRLTLCSESLPFGPWVPDKEDQS